MITGGVSEECWRRKWNGRSEPGILSVPLTRVIFCFLSIHLYNYHPDWDINGQLASLAMQHPSFSLLPQATSIDRSPSQVGIVPDQCPVAPHVRSEVPLSVHPSGHVNSHTVPKTAAPLQLTFIFPGTSRLEHWTAANDRSMVEVTKTLLQNC